MNKVLIIDTSILCVLLKVPEMETCGPLDDRWDFKRVSKKIEKEKKSKTTFVLPLATLIETGNHIAQARTGDRFKTAKSLSEIIQWVADAEEPWAAFSFQIELWNEKGLHKLSESWPELAAAGISIGDATIKDVAEFYCQARYSVEIFTGDAGLKAYEPKTVSEGYDNNPRRRKGSRN